MVTSDIDSKQRYWIEPVATKSAAGSNRSRDQAVAAPKRIVFEAALPDRAFETTTGDSCERAKRPTYAEGTSIGIAIIRDESALPDSSNASVRERPPSRTSSRTKFKAPIRGTS